VHRAAANSPSHPPITPPLPQPDFRKIQKICTKQTQFSTSNPNKTINVHKTTIGFAFGFHRNFHPTGHHPPQPPYNEKKVHSRVPLRTAAAICAVTALSIHADVRDCVCNLTSPAVAETRACSLCIEAAKQPADRPVFLVHDSDPTKPNRWLVLPRAPYDGSNPLARMTAPERLALWNAAIAKAKETWGDSWAVAMNGDIARRQCHAHIHVGKLLEGKETETGVFIDNPSRLPAISDGTGLWFHPVGNRLHVHTGEQINETVLMR